MESKTQELFGDRTITIDGTTTREVKGSLIAHPDLITFTLGFWSPWSWRAKVDRSVNDIIEVSRVMVQRAPTQDEVDAMVQHCSRYAYHSRIGIPIAMTGWGLWFAQDLQKSGLTAPLGKLWRSGERHDMHGWRAVLKEVVQLAKAQPSLARQVAMIGLIRFGFLLPIGWSLSDVIARSMQSKAMLQDIRLATLMREMREQGPEVLRNRRIEAVQERYKRRVAEKPHHDTDAGLAHERAFPEIGDQDQSPISTESSADAAETTSMGILSPRRPSRRPYDAPSALTSRGDDPGDFLDDASPVSSEYRDEVPGQTPQGSVWERIRQQNATASADSHARQDSFQQDEWSNRSSGNRYNKEREREQARADFDKLIESERNMSTDSFASNGSRNW